VSRSVFIRLLKEEDKGAGLSDAVAALRQGREESAVHVADPNSFSKIPGAPFAYWVSEDVRAIFGTGSQLEADGREVQSGASTMDDFRFLRLWPEVKSELHARSR
jgi:hypothetical protein